MTDANQIRMKSLENDGYEEGACPFCGSLLVKEDKGKCTCMECHRTWKEDEQEGR